MKKFEIASSLMKILYIVFMIVTMPIVFMTYAEDGGGGSDSSGDSSDDSSSSGDGGDSQESQQAQEQAENTQAAQDAANTAFSDAGLDSSQAESISNIDHVGGSMVSTITTPTGSVTVSVSVAQGSVVSVSISATTKSGNSVQGSFNTVISALDAQEKANAEETSSILKKTIGFIAMSIINALTGIGIIGSVVAFVATAAYDVVNGKSFSDALYDNSIGSMVEYAENLVGLTKHTASRAFNDMGQDMAASVDGVKAPTLESLGGTDDISSAEIKYSSYNKNHNCIAFGIEC